ncbi:calumenin-B [Hydra vulgaris]|uniref:Calumenin-B n=1 Tax=Hydra vulgaris TaxID=6087 RepID=A0ABM4BBG0_HYDVU
MKSIFVFLVSFFIFKCESTPKDRVIKESDLSSENHNENDIHNKEYDHEAFLGKEDARRFEELTPEESKKRLGELYNKVDTDNDGFVTTEELKQWIKFTQNKYIWNDAKEQMKQNDLNKDDFVTFDEYKKGTYGFADEGNIAHYKDMIARDERRFKLADTDNDGKLSREQFASFLHPESDDNMKPLVVQETLEDIDKNKDGSISLDEYIGDLWPEEDRVAGNEPEWVKSEREQFTNYRDINKDGKMDKEEVAAWILPPDYDHITSEAQHLISEADADDDGKLTKSEVVEKYDLFVGSQATDFGEALKYKHDEM